MSRNGRRDPISDITTSRSAVFGAEVDDLIRELAGREEWENHFASQYVDALHREWGQLRAADPEGATQMLSSFAVALRSELDDLHGAQPDGLEPYRSLDGAQDARRWPEAAGLDGLRGRCELAGCRASPGGVVRPRVVLVVGRLRLYPQAVSFGRLVVAVVLIVLVLLMWVIRRRGVR